ncbi:MAG: acyl-CoA/acyl-ACP dehydrogenase [Actinomycetota bacterium]|jgi:alkylation response protein AidB-like acyl-CoA dehydrogenase|nr:acyl-CoA/acyl-ACP dehydrogenase [Euzebyaceae bacterium]MDQ3452461.1 acyl-CoA/acyl-ACP dehydrogenase [Actinomycetota bacterium]
MRFDYSDEQYQLRDVARDFFAKECPPAAVRAAWDHDTARDSQRWRKMAEMGLVGLTVPTQYGGLGLHEVDLVLLLEEAGRAALPEPLAETTAIAVPTLVEAGTPVQRDEWLPRIAAGDAVATVQLAGTPSAQAAVVGSALVSAAHIADLLLTESGGELHAVPAGRFEAVAQPSMDGARRLFTVRAETGDDTRMDGGVEAAGKAFDRGAWATAALLNGVAQRLLDMTVAYVQERWQFGRPVGSFQAIKHKLAETLLVVETSKAATAYAAYALASGRSDRAEAVSVAKAYASDAAHKANTEALQCHGGIGFTWQHDLHLWLKRGKALEQAYGSATWHRARIAERLFA